MNPQEPPSRAGLLTKRALVIASHSVEQAALAAGEEDFLVLAMFQRLPYFERERAVYERIARRSACTVVGMVSKFRPDLPHGVTPVLLREEEELAREWSVVVVSARFGAVVVATDLAQLAEHGTSLESARLFQGRWGFRRDEAYAEAVRLRDALGDRLNPGVRARIEQVLATVLDQPATEAECRAEAAIRHLATGLERQRTNFLRLRDKVDDDRKFGRDPWTGLHTATALENWVGVSAPDTLPLGLTLVRVPDLAEIIPRCGARNAMHTENNIADLLRQELRAQDRAARLSRTEFLLVQPGATEAGTADTGRRLGHRISGLHTCYPFIGVSVQVSTTVSRARPLPLAALRSRLPEIPGPAEADQAWETAPMPAVVAPAAQA